MFGRDAFLNELIWAYDYGAKPRRRWPAKHDTILVYVRTPGGHFFDADAVEREKWNPVPPNVDVDAGFFFSADTIAGLARKIVMKYQRRPMPPDALEATVARYNGFVDSGTDQDFGKPKPLYKIAKPPFYAAWATPVVHDTRFGLRINAKCQVIDMKGEVIPGLYCGGESAGGFSQHGLARAACQGYIAGGYASIEKV